MVVIPRWFPTRPSNAEMPRTELADGEEPLAFGGGEGRTCCGRLAVDAKYQTSDVGELCLSRGCVLGGVSGVLLSVLIFSVVHLQHECDEGGDTKSPALLACEANRCDAMTAVAHAAAGQHDVGYSGADLGLAFGYLSARGNGVAVVCPLADMTADAGTLVVNTEQMLSVAGSPTSALMPKAPPPPGVTTPRLWARFEVSGVVFLTGLTFRDQSIEPDNYDDPQGAAAMVKDGGRLVATQVTFLNLHTTVTGGAIRISKGGTAEFYGCLFDGCHATNDCGDPRSGGGGALDFEAGAQGTVAYSTLQNNHAGCAGGAMNAVSSDNEHPYLTNITISHTTFASNTAGTEGDDAFVWRLAVGAVPCPEPGEVCPVCHGCTNGEQPCCFDLDESERYQTHLTLPCN